MRTNSVAERLHQFTLCLLAAASLAAHGGEAAAGKQVAGAPAIQAAAVFARVGDAVITHEDFEAVFSQAARSKFYHGKVPDAAVASLQREVGQAMVDSVLLAREAARRGIEPDAAAVRTTLDGYEERYRGNLQWTASRERVLPALRAKLEHDTVVDRLAKQVKSVGEPSEAELLKYWEAHQDKFTTPEQVRVSIILLRVDPSSPPAAWQDAKTEGAALVQRLREGGDFAELARLHSKEPSSGRGGDMGYLHRAMLPESAQEALDKLKPGELSEAIVLLEGVAVLRLEERRSSRLNPLEVVRTRASDLWKRDQGEQAWTALLARLRSETPVELDRSRFLPLAAAAPEDKAAPR